MKRSRRLDKQKLYKLTKAVVIVLSILSLIIAILSYNANQEYNSMYVKSSEECQNERQKNIEVKESTQTINTVWQTCFSLFPETDLDLAASSMHTFELAFLIAILLPVIFFSGVGIYRYIFPLKPER